MLDFDDAQKLLADAVQPVAATQHLPLRQAMGLVLAQDLTAALDMPPADNSAMDGYALRHADYHAGRALPVQQVVYAGHRPEPQRPGTATRLFTGSILPDGADTVVMQEHTREIDGQVEILTPPTLGQHIRRRGEDTARGTQLLPAGTPIGAAQIALLASQGVAEIPVHPAVRVGILTTGDELVPPGAPCGEHQIYNSNGPMLAALVEGMGARVVHMMHAADQEVAITAAFKQLSAQCDLVISVGGVSVGDRDLVKPVLAALGAELALWKVRMKPGKPVALAHVDRGDGGRTPVICLPGNPVSAFAVFAVLVSPMVRRLQGRRDIFPQVSHVKLRTKAPRGDSREEFLRVRRLADADGGETLEAFDRQGSGVVSSLPWASGLARIPAGQTISDGGTVAYYDFRHWLV